ncbi:MAG: UbiD family decarboxylase, partial [Candidatus Bilamarchaeaceae archaeon]
AGVFKALEPTPCIGHATDSPIRCASNIFATRENVARYLDCEVSEIGGKMVHAINNPSKPGKTTNAPVLEETSASLKEIPIPVHTQKDGGPYICSGIVVARDPELGQNCSFHRMMVAGENKLVLRILPRHLDKFLERAGGELDVAVIIGAPINVLLASAISTRLGQSELEIANALMPFETVELMNGIEIPSQVEFAIVGHLSSNKLEKEGPFLDLTETYDVVRKQPVLTVKKIYHRKNPIFHALLPGGLEHKVLMGMPREPTIFDEVNKVVPCTGVNITPGGCSWLHAVVGIRKKNADDGKKAIGAAFKGHASLKHVVVVDEDINIYDMQEVEWAIATRFQGDRGLVVKKGEKGSSLDPSANPFTRETTKVGIDATKPAGKAGKDFEKARYLEVNLRDYE